MPLVKRGRPSRPAPAGPGTAPVTPGMVVQPSLDLSGRVDTADARVDATNARLDATYAHTDDKFAQTQNVILSLLIAGGLAYFYLFTVISEMKASLVEIKANTADIPEMKANLKEIKAGLKELKERRYF